MADSYWKRRISRRRAIGTAGVAGITFLAACGGGNNNATKKAAGTAPPSGAQPSASAGAATSGAAQPATTAATAAAARPSAAPQVKQGGQLRLASTEKPPSQDVDLSASFSIYAYGVGAAYSRLLRSKTGAGIPLPSNILMPDVAAAMPETPDNN